MSADGQYASTVDKDSTVRLFGSRGQLLWRQNVEGATNVLLGRSGQNLLVYSRLDPKHQSVYFFRKDGRRLWRHAVEGNAVAGAVSADGSYAAVTTDKHFIYIYMPDPTRPRYRRWRLDGVGYSVTFTSNNERVIVGTQEQSALVCYSIKGRFLWRDRQNTDRQYNLDVSADGRRILGVLPATQADPGIQMLLWESGGHLLWKHSMEGFEPRALVSPQSQYVAVSYANFLKKGDTKIVERKVAVYGSDGHQLWDKGGLFFGPRLVALSPTGSSVIVSDGERSLYNMDKRGKILSKLTLSGSIRQTLSSEDGCRILLYCGDGWLYLIRVG
jgi:outer membrane protein assembly factor BamB